MTAASIFIGKIPESATDPYNFWKQVGEDPVTLNVPVEIAGRSWVGSDLCDGGPVDYKTADVVVTFPQAIGFAERVLKMDEPNEPIDVGIRYRPDVVKALAQAALPLHHLARSMVTVNDNESEEHIATIFRGLVLVAFSGFEHIFTAMQREEELRSIDGSAVHGQNDSITAESKKTLGILRSLERHINQFAHYAAHLEAPDDRSGYDPNLSDTWWVVLEPLEHLMETDQDIFEIGYPTMDTYTRRMAAIAQILGLELAAAK